MELTGKAKEQFEEWYNSNVAVENEEVKSFLRLPDSMQWGVYQDFAESLGHDPRIMQVSQEGRNAGIKKLNELINQKEIR